MIKRQTGPCGLVYNILSQVCAIVVHTEKMSNVLFFPYETVGSGNDDTVVKMKEDYRAR